MEQLEELFTQAPVFRNLNISQKARIKKLAVLKTYNKGEILVLNGSHWPFVIIIASGLVHANKESSEGRSLTVRTFSDGDVFWGHAIFGNHSTPTTLFAHQATTIYQWSGDEILPILIENGEALWDLCIQLNQRMIEASQTIADIAFNPVVNRLAKLLLEQFDSEQQNYINRKMTLEEMAAKIGTTREVVCRLLYRFSDKNLIQVDRTKFILINKIELNKLADGEIIFTKDHWS